VENRGFLRLICFGKDSKEKPGCFVPAAAYVVLENGINQRETGDPYFRGMTKTMK